MSHTYYSGTTIMTAKTIITGSKCSTQKQETMYSGSHAIAHNIRCTYITICVGKHSNKIFTYIIFIVYGCIWYA